MDGLSHRPHRPVAALCVCVCVCVCVSVCVCVCECVCTHACTHAQPKLPARPPERAVTARVSSSRVLCPSAAVICSAVIYCQCPLHASCVPPSALAAAAEWRRRLGSEPCAACAASGPCAAGGRGLLAGPTPPDPTTPSGWPTRVACLPSSSFACLSDSGPRACQTARQIVSLCQSLLRVPRFIRIKRLSDSGPRALIRSLQCLPDLGDARFRACRTRPAVTACASTCDRGRFADSPAADIIGPESAFTLIWAGP